MADLVYMDIDQVGNLAKAFKAFHDVLVTVERVLTALSNSLKFAALFSFGGTAAAAAYIDRIKPNFKRLADKMSELNKDILDAIKAYQDGDYSGSKHFTG